MQIIKIDNLTLKYQNHEVLRNISFNIEQGDYVALAGPNGAGKTTLIKALLGLIEIDSGVVQINSKKIGYLQQKVSLTDSKFPANVTEIIKSGLIINKKFPKLYSSADSMKVNDIIMRLGISDLKNKLIGNLSGGELQKVLLARALISEPEILFLDEPTTALDPVSRDGFYTLVTDLNEKYNITVLLISHDIGSVGKYAKKLLYIDRKIVFYGTFKELCESSDMTEYFGDVSKHFYCQRHH